jgi:hypothetical protein
MAALLGFRRQGLFLQKIFEGLEDLRLREWCSSHASILPEYDKGVGTSRDL